MGFEPTTPNLGGWCSIRDSATVPTTPALAKEPIRAELPAPSSPNTFNNYQVFKTFSLHLERKGRSENTRIAYEKNLKALALRADLNDTQSVELAIARYKKKNGRPITNNYKSKLCDTYATYCKLNHIEWEKPIYTPEPTTVQPPTQERISMLISSARLEISIKLDIIRTNRTQTRRNSGRKRTPSQQHTPRPKHRNRKNHQRMQPKTTTPNNKGTNHKTPNIHSRPQPKTQRPTLFGKSKNIWRRISQIQKQTSRETQRPNNQNHSPIRPQTLLLHQTTQTNPERRNSKTTDGSQTT